MALDTATLEAYGRLARDPSYRLVLADLAARRNDETEGLMAATELIQVGRRQGAVTALDEILSVMDIAKGR